MQCKTLGLALVLLVTIVSVTTTALATDMFSGTWALNTAKSTESLATIPAVEKIIADEKGIRAAAVNPVGWEHDEYAVKFDGREYPYKSSEDRP